MGGRRKTSQLKTRGDRLPTDGPDQYNQAEGTFQADEYSMVLKSHHRQLLVCGR